MPPPACSLAWGQGLNLCKTQSPPLSVEAHPETRPVGILGVSDRPPSTSATGQVPFSIYWSFLNGAAKGHSALQKEAEPVDPRSMATTKQLPPKDRSDNGSAGEEAAHCHSEGPANHLVQYSRLTPAPQQPQKLLIKNQKSQLE